MCIDGVWEEILLDDMIPVDHYNEPLYNRTKSGELWVILLEKAWAKIFKGYQNIVGGLTREALRDLTGASCKTFFTRGRGTNIDELWKTIREAEKNNWIMTTGTDDISNGTDVYIKKIGIQGCHAYSLLSAIELIYY